MKKLRNPYDQNDDSFCFGCSKKNQDGLNMTFYEGEQEIVSEWEPKSQFQGYANILHGGIQATLMDEIASWVVFIMLETGGVTSKLSTSFKRPVYTNEGKISLKAKLVEKKGRIATIGVELFNSKGQLCSESVVEYFVMSPEKAARAMGYPGIDAFYE